MVNKLSPNHIKLRLLRSSIITYPDHKVDIFGIDFIRNQYRFDFLMEIIGELGIANIKVYDRSHKNYAPLKQPREVWEVGSGFRLQNMPYICEK